MNFSLFIDARRERKIAIFLSRKPWKVSEIHLIIIWREELENRKWIEKKKATAYNHTFGSVKQQQVFLFSPFISTTYYWNKRTNQFFIAYTFFNEQWAHSVFSWTLLFIRHLIVNWIVLWIGYPFALLCISNRQIIHKRQYDEINK